ncbi:hypothetical protein OS493_013171 [Desmophyllum pertusum]|uniref:Uncharacterized protein n=1 Tax=Desmophyllum pertusum TaxID=174260 RepID=A0A9W9YQ17_9CNID|nr:hypothetical protein OS493_013171 [Desmophyllum pertusum]
MDKKDEEHTESTVTQNGEPIIGETEAESKAKEAEKQDMAALEVLFSQGTKSKGDTDKDGRSCQPKQTRRRKYPKSLFREQGHIPSRTGAGPSGKVTQRSTTPASVTCEEKDNNTRTHSEQSCHDSQIALSSERDSAASDELFEKTNSVNKSTECSEEIQASKLQVDNAKQLALNDGVKKQLSVTGIPRQSSGLGNLDSQSKQRKEIFCKIVKRSRLILSL